MFMNIWIQTTASAKSLKLWLPTMMWGSAMASVKRRDGTWPKTHPIPIHIHRFIGEFPSKQVSMNKSNTRLVQLDQDFLVVLTLQIRRNKQLTSSRFQSAIGDQTPVHPVPNLGQVMDRKSRPAECYLISTLSLSATAAVPTKGCWDGSLTVHWGDGIQSNHKYQCIELTSCFETC